MDYLGEVESRVTEIMNTKLQKEFTRGEVEEAPNDMAPLKSPGPNGFGVYFYQTY